MGVTQALLRYEPITYRRLALAVETAALAAIWAVSSPELESLWPALISVLAMWAAAGGIMLGLYATFSLAPFAEIVEASWLTSAAVMWAVPGVLLLASDSQPGVAFGVGAVLNSARLLASGRPPTGGIVRKRRRAGRSSEPMLFRTQAEQRAFFSRETRTAAVGAGALQAGAYALAVDRTLLAAGLFATAAAIWSATSVSRGATATNDAARQPYAAAGALLTLLLTVTLTAVLLASGAAGDRATQAANLLARLMHLPAARAEASKAPEGASHQVATRVVDTGRVIGKLGRNGVPGVMLRPQARRTHRPGLIAPGARLRLPPVDPLAFAFSGEYHLYRQSSGSLPKESPVDSGSPLESVYRTTNGGPMETVAVQMFEPPIDLSHCGKVRVELTSAEVAPVLATMQFVAEGRVEEAGIDLMGMRPGRKQVLEYDVPATARPRLVRAIRIVFRHAGPDGDKNVRIAVEQLILAPRKR
jgi:hypothetical protein